MSFWLHYTSSSSPKRVEGREKRFFSPPLQRLSLSLSLSLSHLPKNTDTTHTPYGLPSRWKTEETSLAGDPRAIA
jgi:hypothetical protein